MLSWRLSSTIHVDLCISALEEALAKFGRPEYHQHRLRQTVYKFCAYERPGGKRFPYFHGLAWAVAEQCVIERLYFLAKQ